MASGSCKDAFAALVDCVAAAVKDSSGTTTTQPLPCLDAAGIVKKCMEKDENAGKYAHTLDVIASGAGEGEEADANRRLVLELMKMQEAQLEAEKAVARMELRLKECKACEDALEALEECAAAGGMTSTKVPLPCLEAAVSLEKCLEGQERADGYLLAHQRRCRQG